MIETFHLSDISHSSAEEVVVAGWTGVFQVIANNYQNWIFLLILILAIAGAVLLGESTIAFL